jgi:hypothetical protein
VLSNESERTTESTRPLALLENRRRDARGDVQLRQARSRTQHRAYNQLLRRRPAVSLALPCGKRTSSKTFFVCTLPSDANRKGRHFVERMATCKDRAPVVGAPLIGAMGESLAAIIGGKIDHYSRLGQLEQAIRIISGQRSTFFPLENTRRSFENLRLHWNDWLRTLDIMLKVGAALIHMPFKEARFLQSLQSEGPLWERLMAEKGT